MKTRDIQSINVLMYLVHVVGVYEVHMKSK